MPTSTMIVQCLCSQKLNQNTSIVIQGGGRSKSKGPTTAIRKAGPRPQYGKQRVPQLETMTPIPTLKSTHATALQLPHLKSADPTRPHSHFCEIDNDVAPTSKKACAGPVSALTLRRAHSIRPRILRNNHIRTKNKSKDGGL